MADFDLAKLPEPRPLTADEYRAAQAEAAVLRTRWQAIKQRGREIAWEYAHILYDIDASSAWGLWGYDSQTDWLEQEGLGPDRYRRLVGSWRELVVIRGVEPSALGDLDPSKVIIALPALRRGEIEVDQLMADVETMTWRQLRSAYSDERQRAIGPSSAAWSPRFAGPLETAADGNDGEDDPGDPDDHAHPRGDDAPEDPAPNVGSTNGRVEPDLALESTPPSVTGSPDLAQALSQAKETLKQQPWDCHGALSQLVSAVEREFKEAAP